jgi:hypothetical protein
MTATLRAPFPWFGGKSRAAHLVWPAFGDVVNYVEPFAGSLAVLLGRPTEPRTETVNDIDCYLSNFWRAVQAAPDEVARWADWPVNEADLHARHRWLVNQAEFREQMKHDPDYFDAKVAGWWVWGICQWIGSGWCAAPEWWRRAHEGEDLGDGRRPAIKGAGVNAKGNNQSLANSHNWARFNAGRRGQGVHAIGPAGWNNTNAGRRNRGILTAEHEQRPDLSSSTNRGVLSVENEKRPHLWRGGLGVHSGRAQAEKLPLLGGRGGKGVLGGKKRDRDLSNSAERKKRPSLRAGGRGITREQLPQLSQLSGDGSGSGRGVLRSSGGVIEWMQRLADRLRRVRVCCGNWDRIVGPAVTTCIGLTGVFLDPPYGDPARDPRLYSHDSMTIAQDVAKWARENGSDPKLRIAICGYENEHDLPGWTCVAWKAGGGYAASAGNHENAKRERIWFSPHCLPASPRQASLFTRTTEDA